MERLIHKYVDKLVSHGLAAPGEPLLAGLDAQIVWNRPDSRTALLATLFDTLSINSLLFARPAQPYAAIIDYLAARADEAIFPIDCESRTFFHDLPVAREFSAKAIAAALRRRKSVTIPGEGIVTFGTVSPEQAFVTFSSVCFACYVKFHLDYLRDARAGKLTSEQRAVFDLASGMPNPLPETPPTVRRGPFSSDSAVLEAIWEAGRLTVDYRMVDSFFGNVSCRRGDTLFITQTGSSLDELPGRVDACPMDGSSCAGLTASSELKAHREIALRSGCTAVLHGHPKFSVILSMDCPRVSCPHEGECHIKCPEVRSVCGVPVVPGEVGAGQYGLATTLPPVFASGHKAGIVYGHGLFTTGAVDFSDAFATMLSTERACREEYFRRVDRA
ncbi:MAG: class II aldolase/adducin family protein [Planctomycetota bacterium]